ncbi:hypothetical protein [Paracoccus yeei]|nr:hypothetical protein [Paracoccus yeei]
MMRRFLKETPTEGMRSLTVGRHLVHDSWDQLRAYLSAALSPAHADLFAEPFRGSGSISWMASTPVDPLPFASLSPEQQDRTLTRLGELLGDIAQLSQERQASRSDEDRQWGALLEAIGRQPEKVNLLDRLFLAGDQPVLILWGCRDQATISTESLLRETRERGATPAVPQSEARLAETQTFVAAAVPPGRWWLPALLWLLFLGVLALIYWLLLVACAVQWPPAWQIVGSCRDSALVDQARNRALLADLQRLRTGLANSAQCRVEGGPSAAWAAPTPPAPTTAPRIQRSETDLDRARERAGGRVGDTTVTLLWNGQSDLDLEIECPDGSRLTAARARNGAMCGGHVDVDANRCIRRPGAPGTPCANYEGSPVQSPVENAYFLRAQAMPGHFTVWVRHYASAPGSSAPVPYVLQLRQGDQREMIEGTALPGAQDRVTTFQVD